VVLLLPEGDGNEKCSRAGSAVITMVILWKAVHCAILITLKASMKKSTNRWSLVVHANCCGRGQSWRPQEVQL